MSNRPTSHRQCVLVVVGLLVNRLSIMTPITSKNTPTKLNGLQDLQIWIINPSIQPLSNTTEWTSENASLPSLTDWSWGKSANSIQSTIQTSQWKSWRAIETAVTDNNGIKRGKIAKFKTGIFPKHIVTDHQWLQWLKWVEWVFCDSGRIQTSNPQVLNIEWNRVQFCSILHNMILWERHIFSKRD